MAKNNAGTEATETQAPSAPDTTVNAGSIAIRSKRAIMMKEFLPSPGVVAQLVAGGKGSRMMLGRVIGVVTGAEWKKGQLPNGEPSQSAVLKGVFETEDYTTGELGEAVSAYLPGAFAEKILTMFHTQEHLKAVQVDLDIGIEATGKIIPYTWVVIQHVEGQAFEPLRQLKASRSRPEGVGKLLPAPK